MNDIITPEEQQAILDFAFPDEYEAEWEVDDPYFDPEEIEMEGELDHVKTCNDYIPEIVAHSIGKRMIKGKELDLKALHLVIDQKDGETYLSNSTGTMVRRITNEGMFFTVKEGEVVQSEVRSQITTERKKPIKGVLRNYYNLYGSQTPEVEAFISKWRTRSLEVDKALVEVEEDKALVQLGEAYQHERHAVLFEKSSIPKWADMEEDEDLGDVDFTPSVSFYDLPEGKRYKEEKRYPSMLLEFLRGKGSPTTLKETAPFSRWLSRRNPALYQRIKERIRRRLSITLSEEGVT
jgi:hypothetical protein